MRTKVRSPLGSKTVLKASAEKGWLASQSRVAGCPRSSWPFTGAGRWARAGKSQTASSIACTPLLRSAAPHSTTSSLASMVPLRSAATISAGWICVSSSRKLLEQRVVHHAGGLEHLVAGALRGLQQLRRDRLDDELGVVAGVAEVAGLHVDQVDVAAVLGLLADRQHDRHGVYAQARAHRVDAEVEIGADAVELVDEGDARHVVLVGLAPDGLGLRLDARHAVEHAHGPVEHAQRALDLGREVHVAGSVDQVDGVLAPLAARGRRRDRDPALALLREVVHDRLSLVDLADLAQAAGVEEHTLAHRGLSRVDVAR
jgi:hypothetical protein